MRTAHDLLSEVDTLPPEWGLVLLDRALAGGGAQRDLIEAAWTCLPCTRWLITIADGRAASATESLLRFAWYCAELPTPLLRRSLPTPYGGVRTICATDYHRFAVATDATLEQRTWLARRGWHVLVIDEEKVRTASALRLTEHLRAEHLHHLGTVGLGGQHDLLTA